MMNVTICKYLNEIEGLRKSMENLNEKRSSFTKVELEKFEKQREIFGFDEREVYALDLNLAEYLYTRLRMYQDVAYGVIDDTTRKYKYRDTLVSEGEAVNLIIKACKNYLAEEYIPGATEAVGRSDMELSGMTEYQVNNRITSDFQEALILFAEMAPSLRW